MLAGLTLAAPGSVAVDTPAEAGGHALAFGLACLRIPLDAGGVEGTFSLLTGLAVVLWGLSTSCRHLTPRWPGTGWSHAGLVGLAFSAVAAGGAAVAGPLSELDPSVPVAAVAGLVWGAAGAALGRMPRGGPRALRSRAPGIAPGIEGAGAALVVAGVCFVVAAPAFLAGLAASELVGSVVLTLAALPNAAVALTTLGLGARLDVLHSGGIFGDAVSESPALWDWGSGIAPVPALVFVLAPVAAVILASRRAAHSRPEDRTIVRGLRNGVVLGVTLALAGWVGALGATTGEGADEVAVSVGSNPFVVVSLAVVWSVAGAFVFGARR